MVSTYFARAPSSARDTPDFAILSSHGASASTSDGFPALGLELSDMSSICTLDNGYEFEAVIYGLVNLQKEEAGRWIYRLQITAEGPRVNVQRTIHPVSNDHCRNNRVGLAACLENNGKW